MVKVNVEVAYSCEGLAIAINQELLESGHTSCRALGLLCGPADMLVVDCIQPTSCLFIDSLFFFSALCAHFGFGCKKKILFWDTFFCNCVASAAAKSLHFCLQTNGGPRFRPTEFEKRLECMLGTFVRI